MHIEEIVNWIEQAFGEPPALEGSANSDDVRRAMKGEEYQDHLQDLINRQIIRDYLTNAVLLGVIGESGLPAFAPQIATQDGRAALALHMLMSSVEEAPNLPLPDGEVETLKPLAANDDEHSGTDRSHIKLVPN